MDKEEFKKKMLKKYGEKSCDFCHAKIDPDVPGYANRIYCSKDCQKKVAVINQLTSAIQYRRFYILCRDNFSCVLCGASAINDNVKLEIDHIYPRCETMLSILDERPERLMTLCSSCNRSKSKKMLDNEVIEKIILRNIERQNLTI